MFNLNIYDMIVLQVVQLIWIAFKFDSITFFRLPIDSAHVAFLLSLESLIIQNLMLQVILGLNRIWIFI